MSLLLPEGIAHVADMPYPIHDAVVAALRWLRLEEFPPEEQPPKRIWLDAEKMESWWAKVERERKAKYKVGGSDEIEGPVSKNDFSLIDRG